MTRMTLTMLDTSGIQEYVFRSNRLQENIGASEIVYRVTTQWAFDALDEEKLIHNVTLGDREMGEWGWKDKETPSLPHSDWDAEVVFAGGGNTLILFRDGTGETAKKFTRRLTHRVLKEAPGLNVVVGHWSLEWETEPLWQAQEALLRDLARHKRSRSLSSPLLGLGVTEPCDSTGLVAVRTDERQIKIEKKLRSLRIGGQDNEPARNISRETMYKLGWRDLANARLKQQVGQNLQGAFDFPSDIDHLGRAKGEESFVAVVHADGNAMGQHVKHVADGLSTDDLLQANQEYVIRLRKFSDRVNEASLAALRRIVDLTAARLHYNQDANRYEIQREPGDPLPINGRYLPFRPLVFGGDDVTFLTAGPLGLSLAVAYLQAFEEETATAFTEEINQGKPTMHAGAGVAIVKSHYPFSRAYDLSEKLTGSAKEAVRKWNEGDQSAIDWHFALTGLGGDLRAIREREYRMAEDQGLLMRPLRLRATTLQQDGRYWLDGVERVINDFQTSPLWADRRNKVKGLLQAIAVGPNESERYRQTYGLPELPELLPGDPTARRTGWAGGRCAYFDALELLDHHVPLQALEVAR